MSATGAPKVRSGRRISLWRCSRRGHSKTGVDFASPRSTSLPLSLKPPNGEHVSATVRQYRFAHRQPATGRHGYQRIQLGPLRTGLLTVGAAVLASAVFYCAAQVAAPYDAAFLPLGNVSAPVMFAAALLHAGLLQLVRTQAALKPS